MITAMDDWDLDTPAQKKARPSESGPAVEPATTPPAARAPLTESSQIPERASDPRPPSRGVRAVQPRTLRQKMGSPSVWIVAALVMLLIGVLIGFFIARSQAAGDAAVLTETRAQLGELQRALSQSEDRNWTYYRLNEVLKVELEQARSSGQTSTSITVPGSSGAGSTYGDGVYIVGENISPGTYDGVVNDKVGYWARLKGTDGSASAIIANAIPRGPFVLTIQPADKAVELRGVEIRSR